MCSSGNASCRAVCDSPNRHPARDAHLRRFGAEFWEKSGNGDRKQSMLTADVRKAIAFTDYTTHLNQAQMRSYCFSKSGPLRLGVASRRVVPNV